MMTRTSVYVFLFLFMSDVDPPPQSTIQQMPVHIRPPMPTQTYAHLHAHAHACTHMHAHAHTPAHAHAHIRTPTCPRLPTHTHTHRCVSLATPALERKVPAFKFRDDTGLPSSSEARRWLQSHRCHPLSASAAWVRFNACSFPTVLSYMSLVHSASDCCATRLTPSDFHIEGAWAARCRS